MVTVQTRKVYHQAKNYINVIIFVLEFFRGITWRVFDSKRVMDRGAYRDVRIVFFSFFKRAAAQTENNDIIARHRVGKRETLYEVCEGEKC